VKSNFNNLLLRNCHSNLLVTLSIISSDSILFENSFSEKNMKYLLTKIPFKDVYPICRESFQEIQKPF